MITIALFVVYQIFYGLLSYYQSSTVKANPEDVADLDAKLWIENTPVAAAATVFLLLVRVAGIAYLFYLGYRTDWKNPVLLFLGALVIMAIVNTFIRKYFGGTLPALLAFLILPIVGGFLWYTT